MKKISEKTPITHPELVKVGALCSVLESSEWIGAYDELRKGNPTVWLRGRIVEICRHKDEPEKFGLIVRIRKSAKHHTVGIDRALFSWSQLDQVRLG